MNEADALETIGRYATSWFVDRDASGWFERPAEIGTRACKGKDVPILRGRELVSAMIDNVTTSRDDVTGTKERLGKARLDGLFDPAAFVGVSKRTKVAWLAAANGIRGDYSRAVAELKHWEEYAELASAGQLPTLKTGGGTELVAALADAKTYSPDPRLPPERDDDDYATDPQPDAPPDTTIPF